MTRWTRLLLGLATLALIGLVLARSWFIVDETQFVILTELGRPLAVYGDEPGEAGLHFKPFWQEAISVDRRVQLAEPAAREAITGDKRNVEVMPFLVWKVADPLRFLRSVGTPTAAASRLEERINAAYQDELGRRPFDTLASTDPRRWGLDELNAAVRAAVAPGALEELGVDLVDVRLRRFNHPLEVRPAIFDLIRAERKQEAARLRAEGEAEYQQIVSRADRERDEAIATAEAEAATLRSKGEAEALRVLNTAQARDPEFAHFLRQLEAYRSVLDANATVILPASSPLLRLLLQGPDAAPASLMPGAEPSAHAAPGAGR